MKGRLMNQNEQIIERLAASARRVRLPEDGCAPPGFSTRIVASIVRDTAAMAWERLGWRSLVGAGIACGLCLWWESRTPLPDEDALLINQITLAPFQS